jgi:acetyltransferase-like isoleucine patch superfamily enzyme
MPKIKRAQANEIYAQPIPYEHRADIIKDLSQNGENESALWNAFLTETDIAIRKVILRIMLDRSSDSELDASIAVTANNLGVSESYIREVLLYSTKGPSEKFQHSQSFKPIQLERSAIAEGAEVRNPDQVRFGKDCIVKKYSILDGRSQGRDYGIEMREDVYIKEFCYIDSYGGHIDIVGPAAISQYCYIAGHGGVEIGKYVMIGPGTRVVSANHNFKSSDLPFILQGSTEDRVKICDNVWIGANCTILPGVTIGRNSIVAAGSIVAKDVPEDSIYRLSLREAIITPRGEK